MFDPPYPKSLEADLQVLERYEAKRGEYSKQAGDAKKSFYRTQWIAVLGGVMLVGLGAAGLGLPAESTAATVINVVEAFVGAIVGGYVLFAREKDSQREWLGSRSASEALKHQFVYFLGRVGRYGETDDPQEELEQQVRFIDRQYRRFVSLGMVPEEHGGNGA
jgi:hypothetical protein